MVKPVIASHGNASVAKRLKTPGRDAEGEI
jgi:hypothetical protein